MAKKKKLSPQQKKQKQDSTERKDYLFDLIQTSLGDIAPQSAKSINPLEMGKQVSSLLMSLCEPTFAILKGEEKLIVSVAVVAWNMSIYPEAYTFNKLKAGLKIHKGISEGGSKLVVEIAEVLKLAKEQFYPEVRCIIQNYTFKDLGNAYHLQTTVTTV